MHGTTRSTSDNSEAYIPHAVDNTDRLKTGPIVLAAAGRHTLEIHAIQLGGSNS